MAKQTGPIRIPPAISERPERRACIRQACDLPVTCGSLSSPPGSFFPGRIQDLSTDGLSLLLDRRVELHTLSLHLQNAPGNFAVTKLARVKHTRSEGAVQWRLGAAFVKKLTNDELRWLLE
jgi:hypothetical protein